jgi:hypothetical protein
VHFDLEVARESVTRAREPLILLPLGEGTKLHRPYFRTRNNEDFPQR